MSDQTGNLFQPCAVVVCALCDAPIEEWPPECIHAVYVRYALKIRHTIVPQMLSMQISTSSPLCVGSSQARSACLAWSLSFTSIDSVSNGLSDNLIILRVISLILPIRSIRVVLIVVFYRSKHHTFHTPVKNAVIDLCFMFVRSGINVDNKRGVINIDTY